MLSKETKEEFGLKDDDIPNSMKQTIPSNFVNFVDNNIKINSLYTDFNKAAYLSKIKTNIKHQIQASIRVKMLDKDKKKKLSYEMKKWEDFKEKRS